MKEKNGNLEKIGLPKLLHLIYKKGDPAGILDIVREPVKKRFYFKDGLPVFATSNILGEVLGRLLMDEGVITQRDYEQSLEAVLKDKRKHGEVLVSMGLITPEELDTFLSLQLKKRLWKVFGWNEGTFRYIKSESFPPGITPFPINTAHLILEGISLGFYQASRMKADLAGRMDERLTLAKDFGRYNFDDFRINLQEKRFLESLDGTRTLKEALDSSDLLRHRALSLADTFIITGLASGTESEPEPELFEEELKETKAPEGVADKRVNAELLFMRAKSAMDRGGFAEAKGILKEITELNPVEGEYWAYLGWAVYNEDPANVKEAEKILKDSIDLNNELDSAWYFLGMVFLAEKNYEWAERALRMALSKNPWHLSAASEIKRLEIEKTLKTGEDRPYLKYFGLAEDPFTPVPKAKYLSASVSQSDAADFIVKGIKKKTGPILLEGERGTGKTTVALQVLKRLSGDKVLAALILKPEDREIKLIRAINAEIAGATDAPTTKEQLLSLGMRVSQNKIQSGHSVIIIDEAHELNNGCLKLIQYLSRLKTLQIILMGEPSFSERLNADEFKELRDKLSSRFALMPFNAGELRAFIEKRVENTGSKNLPSFTEDALGALFKKSDGNAAEALRIAALAFNKAAELGREEIDGGLIDTALGKKEAETPGFNIEPEVSQASEKPEEREEAIIPETAPPAFSIEETEKPKETYKEPVKEAAPEEKKPIIEAPKPAETKPESKEKAYEELKAEKPAKKRSFAASIIWIIVMVVAGLFVGSLIGTYWFGQGVSNENAAPSVNETVDEDMQSGGADTSAPIDNSIDTGAIDGSNP